VYVCVYVCVCRGKQCKGSVSASPCFSACGCKVTSLMCLQRRLQPALDSRTLNGQSDVPTHESRHVLGRSVGDVGGFMTPTYPTPHTRSCHCYQTSQLFCAVKLEFHRTDTDIPADFRARIVHEPDTHEDPRRLVRHEARFLLARMSIRDALVYTCRVLYTISYRVHVYKITR